MRSLWLQKQLLTYLIDVILEGSTAKGKVLVLFLI